MEPLTLHAFPRAILHIDGDAFFASCEQSRRPKLQGRPVVTGKERGIAASMSYEAKARGVTRGMRMADIRKVCPEAVILPSDYETYSLLSKRFFAIVRRYTPDVEEYSIDECFCDLTGLRRRCGCPISDRRPHQTGTGCRAWLYLLGGAGAQQGGGKDCLQVGQAFRPDRHPWPGAAPLPGAMPVEKVWGIGPNTTAFLQKHGIRTALEFAQRPEAWVKKYFSKPFYQIWQELNGAYVFELATGEHETYYTIQKVKTFTQRRVIGSSSLRSLPRTLRMPASRRASTNWPPSAW